MQILMLLSWPCNPQDSKIPPLPLPSDFGLGPPYSTIQPPLQLLLPITNEDLRPCLKPTELESKLLKDSPGNSYAH